MTRNPPHRIALAHLRDLLQSMIIGDWHIDSQEAITLEASEPEPEIAVVRGRVDDYPDRHPGPADIALVAEVSDSTLANDRGLKKRIYARAAIAEYWIVNLVERQIDVFSDPTGPSEQPDYRQQQIFRVAQTMTVKIAEVTIGQLALSQPLP
jgi:Uma2 family endonuclease